MTKTKFAQQDRAAARRLTGQWKQKEKKFDYFLVTFQA